MSKETPLVATAPTEEVNKGKKITEIINKAEEHLNTLYARQDIKFSESLRRKLEQEIDKGTGTKISESDLIAKQIAVQMSNSLPDGGPSALTIRKFFGNIIGRKETLGLAEKDMPTFKISSIGDDLRLIKEAEEKARKQQEEAVKAAETAKKKEARPAQTTDDLPTKPKNQAPELGSARDSREMATLVFAAEQRARKEAELKAAETERKQKEESTDKAKSPAPLLIKWHEPGPRDLLRPDPMISRLEAQAQRAREEEARKQQEAEVKAPEAAKKKKVSQAKPTDDLSKHAEDVLAASQLDHAAQQEAAEKAEREEATKKLEKTLFASLRTEIKAAKNPSWLSRTGEFHVERDRLAQIMAEKTAKKIADNPKIPTAYIAGHAEEISRTTVETLRTKTMAGTADPDALEKKDKTYKQLSEEFLEHRKNVADINEVLTGRRATGRSFDDKLAEATSVAVAEEAKLEQQKQQQSHQKKDSRGVQ